MQTPFNPILPANDDGLFIDEVGEWSESKYKLIGNYCNLFTKTMYSKFERLVYIDLFSGCGYSKIRNSTKIIKGSPLSLPNNFTDYIFCDEDENKITALKERANKILKNNPQIKSHFIKGKCNLKIDDIIKCMPQYSPQNRVLTFCFVDPYNIEIDFSTISKLSYYKIDFMILLAFGMDAKRNYKYYLEDKNKRIEKLLNNKEWRKIFTDNFTPLCLNPKSNGLKSPGIPPPAATKFPPVAKIAMPKFLPTACSLWVTKNTKTVSTSHCITALSTNRLNGKSLALFLSTV